MRRRLLIFLVLMTCGIAGAWAEELTKEQALDLARQFVAGQQGKRAAAAGNTVAEAGLISGLYVFNVGIDGGFVIVSNDDQTAPILGYSDSGSIDPDNLPANLRAWLQSYADQIAWVKANGVNGTHRANRTNRTMKTAVEPLVETRWSQGAPYNNLCPEIDGTKTVTGCVATTIAQIMYYHYARNGFEASSTAIPGYTTTTKNKAKESISLDVAGLGTTTFEWGDMTTTYTVASTGVAADAVAQLMLYCGTAIQMIYGLRENGGSSAYGEAIPFALKTCFGYDGGIQHCYRKNYSYDAWVDLIYSELSNSRPVALGGQSAGGGHSFICDGYDNNDHNGASGDYFHINWGWGGTSDGYFLLSVLNPEDQGIGGSSSLDGFSYGQDVVIGIQKPTDGTKDYCLSLEGLRLGGDGEASLSSKTFNRVNETDDFTGISLYYDVWNYYYGTNAFDYAVQLVDGSGNVKHTFYEALDKTMEWNENNNKKFNDGIRSGLTIPAKADDDTDLTDGTYYIKVMSRPYNATPVAWQECYDGDAYKLTAVISGNDLTISVPIPDNVLPASVEFSEVTGDLMTGHAHTVTATITGGAGKYNGDIFLRVNDETVMGTILNIGAGEEQELQLSFNPLKVGTNTITLYAGNTKIGTGPSIENVAFTLDNSGDNTNIIKANNGTRTNATLYGRTLYKDGKWNTLCLPFDVTIAGSPLDGAEARTLSSASITGTTLTLNFSDPVTTLQAGTPYIIKWASGTDIKNPVFTDVTIDNSDEAVARKTITSADGRVKFKGLYSSHTFTADDMRYLLVGANNTLYWPKVGATLGTQRAYFQIAEEGQQAPAINSFNLTFGDESTQTGIGHTEITEITENSDAWYTLDGRKLQDTPTQKGVYIYKGVKRVIK